MRNINQEVGKDNEDEREGERERETKCDWQEDRDKRDVSCKNISDKRMKKGVE